MSDRVQTILAFYAISAAIAVFHLGYVIFGNGYQNRATEGFVAITVISGIGIALFVGATLALIYTLYENNLFQRITSMLSSAIGSAFSFFGKLAFAIWGIVITVAVAYLTWKQLGITSKFGW